MEYIGKESGRGRDDGIKQFVRSCVPPTQRQFGGEKTSNPSIDPSECMATGLCVCVRASVCLWVRQTVCVSPCVRVLADLCDLKAESSREGGGTPASVCQRGGADRASAVSCSLSDTAPATFEIFFHFVLVRLASAVDKVKSRITVCRNFTFIQFQFYGFIS